jgi:hypothetical protein
MKKIPFLSFCILLILLINSNVQAKEYQSIEGLLKKKVPGLTIEKIDNGHHFKEEFVLMLDQPLDHNNPSAGTFQQRIFLAHFDRKAPTLVVTEGYAARPTTYELADMLKSNQLIVEYRFFGKSKPQNNDYQYLNNDQAVEDLHRIKKLFKKIYCKSWISTGISKGGTTCLIYKAKYPKDVKVVIPYVAPLPTSQTDKRCDDLILNIGEEACRDKLAFFQKKSLEHRKEIMPMIDSLAKADNMTFNTVGMEAAFEYAVLEFTFSFWQWGHECDKIPEFPTAKEAFDILNEIIGFDFYSDEVIDYFKPAFYQFMKENGYYGFIHEHLKDKLTALDRFDNIPFAPQDQDLSFNAKYLEDVRTYLEKSGDKIIHIQGENDPWGACGFIPPEGQDALHLVKKGGSHFTRIKDFSEGEKAAIYAKLAQWLKVKVYPIESN